MTRDSQSEGRLAGSVERLRQEFDRWIDTALTQGNRALDAMGLRGSDRAWSPAVDIVELPDAVQVFVDLPGVDPRSVDVSLTGNMLTIKGEKASLASGEGKSVHFRERVCGPFERLVALPAPVSSESVTAEGKDGVIRLHFPKTNPATVRQIAIRAVEPPTSV